MIANASEDDEVVTSDTNMVSLKFGSFQNGDITKSYNGRKSAVLILGAGRVCQPATELLASVGSTTSHQWLKSCTTSDYSEQNRVHVIVASLYMKDAEEVH